MAKPPALNNYKAANLAGQALLFKQSKIKPDEVLALLTDLKESFEELHKKLRRAGLPKELEAAESLTSTSKLSSRWELPFLLGQHSLERKPRLLLDGWNHSESWLLSLSERTQLSILRRP